MAVLAPAPHKRVAVDPVLDRRIDLAWFPVSGHPVPLQVKDKPTTLYIYPESGDIDAVAQAVKTGRSPSRAGLYWNASCLRAIRSPKFWPKETLEPIIAQYRKDHSPRRDGGRGHCRFARGSENCLSLCWLSKKRLQSKARLKARMEAMSRGPKAL
jgi:hypothetical protein